MIELNLQASPVKNFNRSSSVKSFTVASFIGFQNITNSLIINGLRTSDTGVVVTRSFGVN